MNSASGKPNRRTTLKLYPSDIEIVVLLFAYSYFLRFRSKARLESGEKIDFMDYDHSVIEDGNRER